MTWLLLFAKERKAEVRMSLSYWLLVVWSDMPGKPGQNVLISKQQDPAREAWSCRIMKKRMVVFTREAWSDVIKYQQVDPAREAWSYCYSYQESLVWKIST